MKKKLIIIILLLFLVVGCGKDVVKIESKAERDAKREIANVEDINKENIQESLDYISKYLNGIRKNSGNYGTLYRHVYKINYICSKDSSLKENKVCKVGSLSKYYIDSPKKDYIKEVNDLLDEIDDSNEINSLIEKYHSTVSYKSDLDEIKEKVLIESKTEGFITKEKLNKATDYLLANYSKPFANSEVLYKLTYYTEYLSKVGSIKKENELIEFSNLVKKYITTQDEKTKQDIESRISKIENKKNELIKELL
jgi:hypothetical protein